MKKLVCILLFVLALAPAPARADNDERERADLEQAVRKGELLALSAILEIVTPKIDGRILEIEFEYEDGVPVYEIYVLAGDGRRLEYEIDARTAEILKLDNDD